MSLRVYYDDDEELEEEEEVYENVDEEEEIGEEIGVLKMEEIEDRNGERDGDERRVSEELAENVAEEEKKVNEPFAVPTAGAFYIHDDLFRESGRGRNRFSGGRKLWES